MLKVWRANTSRRAGEAVVIEETGRVLERVATEDEVLVEYVLAQASKKHMGIGIEVGARVDGIFVHGAGDVSEIAGVDYREPWVDLN